MQTVSDCITLTKKVAQFKQPEPTQTLVISQKDLWITIHMKTFAQLKTYQEFLKLLWDDFQMRLPPIQSRILTFQALIAKFDTSESVKAKILLSKFFDPNNLLDQQLVTVFPQALIRSLYFTPRQVQFNLNPVIWYFQSNPDERKSIWMIEASNRAHFKSRIESVGAILNPILLNKILQGFN